MTKEVSKLERVSLREIWPSESGNFTPWLEENIDVLSDAISTLTLVSAEKEGPCGDFSVDLLAEDENGDPVVIENQLEKSDHQHLGKLLTYMVAVSAKKAIWITPEPRPEHVAAISWLNEAYSADFYLLKVEAVSIDDSKPAPLFTTIVEPSVEGKKVGETKKELGERHLLRQKFWAGLLDYAKTKSKLHAGKSPTHYTWIGTRYGGGFGYNYTVRQDSATAELYIDKGSGYSEWNRKMFDELEKSKKAIEEAFGGPLEWEELEGKQACRIKKVITAGGYRSDEAEWPKIYEDMVDTMTKLYEAIHPYVKKLTK